MISQHTGNDLVPTGNKPLLEPMLAQIYVAMRWERHSLCGSSYDHFVTLIPKLNRLRKLENIYAQFSRIEGTRRYWNSYLESICVNYGTKLTDIYLNNCMFTNGCNDNNGQHWVIVTARQRVLGVIDTGRNYSDCFKRIVEALMLRNIRCTSYI